MSADNAPPTMNRPIGPTMKITKRTRTTPITPRIYFRHVGPDFYLDLGAAGERGDLDGRAGGLVIAERLGVDGVDRGELPDVGDEHRRLGDVGEARAAVAQHRGDVRQHLTGLGLDAAGDHRAGRGIETDLAGQHEPVAGAHGRASTAPPRAVHWVWERDRPAWSPPAARET